MPMAEFEENNDFDQLRNLLEGAEIAPSRDLWPEIESKLENSPRRPFVLWFSIAGLLLSVTLITAYFYTNSNDKNMQLSSIESMNATDKTVNETVVSQTMIDNKESANDLGNKTSASKLKVGDDNSERNNAKVNSTNSESISSKNESGKDLNNTTRVYKSKVSDDNSVINNGKVNIGSPLQEKYSKGGNINNTGSNNKKLSSRNLKLANLKSYSIGFKSNIDRNINKNNKSNVTTLTENEKEILNSKVAKPNKSVQKNNLSKSSESKVVYNKISGSEVKGENLDITFDRSNNLKDVSNVLLSKQSETSILNNNISNKTQSELNDLKVNEKLNYLLVKSKPLQNDSLKYKERNVAVTNRKSNIFNAQKSYDLISSVNYFYNNDYKPESNMLITNSYKYGILVNYYVNKNWGLGLGIVQNTIFYNSVLLEKQNESIAYTSIKEVKVNDSTYVLTQKDTLLTKSKDVANYKSLQIKSVNIPLQLLYKFKVNNKFSVENRVGLVTSFASSQSKKITRTVGFAYQHNLNLLYRITPNIQLLFGPEYSFYITDLVQNKAGWYPLGLHIGARINLK